MTRSNPTREKHQPKPGPIDRPVPTKEQLKSACGKTVALVLATDFGATPLRVAFEDPDKEPIVCGAAEEGELGIPRPLQQYEGTPVIAHAVACAVEAQFASVSVLEGGSPEQRSELETPYAAHSPTLRLPSRPSTQKDPTEPPSTPTASRCTTFRRGGCSIT